MPGLWITGQLIAVLSGVGQEAHELDPGLLSATETDRQGRELLMRGTLVCLRGGNPLPGERITFGLHHDAGSDTLTDDAGVVWTRAG